MKARLAAVAAGALLLTGCGALDESGGTDTEAPEGATTVKVGYLHTVAVDNKLHYGLAEGHWADADLDIEATQFDTGIAVSQALVSGDIDVAIMGGVTSNFPAQGQGQIFMINSVETATARLYVQGDSDIQSVADLPGHTLVTTEGTTADIFLHAAMKKAGIARDTVNVVNAAMPDAVQAFVSGSADAIALWVPFDLRVAEGAPDAREIDDAGNYPEATVADGWIANNDWFEDNRDVAKQIASAWLDINEDYQADPEAALEVVHATAYEDQATLEDLQHQVEYMEDYSNEEWVEKYESGELLDIVGTAEQAFVELGGLPQYVEPETFFDTSIFLEAAEERE